MVSKMGKGGGGGNQQDATIRCLLSTSATTCFGHHYVHLQENKDLCYCMRCAALVLLDVVGSGCGALRCRAQALLTPYTLLKMGIMMPETCLDRS